MNIEEITESQEWLMARHSRTVGQVLDVIEASLPEGTQCEKVKKLIQQHLYALRNDVLKVITSGKISENLE
jgi:DNA-binding FrmR family transcriptional regulator